MYSDKNQVLKIDGKFVYFKKGDKLPESKQEEPKLAIIEEEKEVLDNELVNKKKKNKEEQ